MAGPGGEAEVPIHAGAGGGGSTASSAPQDGGQDDRNQAAEKQRFFRIYQDVLTEGGGAAKEEAFVRAIKLAKTAHAGPKYFHGDPPRLEAVDAIDAIAQGGGGPGEAEPARQLYSDLFYLCMALKSRKGEPATAEDPNFDPERLEGFFNQLPREAAVDLSLEALGSLADAVLAQGCSELGASPAKLRAVPLMLSHPGLGDPGSFEVLKKLLQLVAQLHAQTPARETLSRWYAVLPLAVMERLVSQVQQFLTLELLEAQMESTVDTLDKVMKLATKGHLARHSRNALRLLDILWQANERRRKVAEDWGTFRKAQLMRQRGELFEDEAARFLPVSQFHNDAINECEGILKHDLKEALEAQQRSPNGALADAEEDKRNDFGVIEFPFVLSAVSKVRILSIESLLTQREEVRNAMAWQVLVRGRMPLNPYLVLKVRRTAIIEDALQQLAAYGAQQYKKPLKVVFDGEEAVDEGGVQKEFFQLLIEELYNEDFGMFERVEESRTFWFNKNSFEANLQFELFGTILGLAIYNQVILDVKFPRVVYKKLMGASNFGLRDLLDFEPSLAQGLSALLEHEDAASFEEVFGPLHFVVEYDCFGVKAEDELMPGGKETRVTYDNREEYVQRYCDWIFGKSVERQFGAFRKGFDQCIGDTLFRRLFRDDELELVICGSMELDFGALEKATQYQDGFSASSDAVRWFWEVVHSLSPSEKRSLLQFCTGCDRAPVGGLGRLPFIVSRAGPDSDMLPWVHTCFNHLLLPAYCSKEKLDRRLRLAIQHSTGFGLM